MIRRSLKANTGMRDETSQFPRREERFHRSCERLVEIRIERAEMRHVVVRLHDELEIRRGLPLHGPEGRGGGMR